MLVHEKLSLSAIGWISGKAIKHQSSISLRYYTISAYTKPTSLNYSDRTRQLKKQFNNYQLYYLKLLYFEKFNYILYYFIDEKTFAQYYIIVYNLRRKLFGKSDIPDLSIYEMIIYKKYL